MESPSNHSRSSSKSLATFASSDFSDAYMLGRAMPVPIIPTSISMTVLDRAKGREKPLPKLPVAENSVLAMGTEMKTAKDETGSRVVGVREGEAGPVIRDPIAASLEQAPS